MSNYRRANTQGGTYFFTVVTFRRQRFLCDGRVRSALREGINLARKEHPFSIDAWVLLPDHLHCIWTLPPSDADFSVRWAIIKRFVTKQCNPELKREDWMKPSILKRKESTLWQRRFWEHQIRDEKDYEKHIDYIHYNPVKHGLAKHALDWPFSTFHRYVKMSVFGWAGRATGEEIFDVGEPQINSLVHEMHPTWLITHKPQQIRHTRREAGIQRHGC